MSNEVESSDNEKLSAREFIELIVHLSDDEILLTECFVDTWFNLVSKNKKKGYFDCNLCKNTIVSFKNVREHLEGKKHRTNIAEILEWFHPQYTGPKRLAESIKTTKAAVVQQVVPAQPNVNIEVNTTDTAKDNVAAATVSTNTGANKNNTEGNAIVQEAAKNNAKACENATVNVNTQEQPEAIPDTQTKDQLEGNANKKINAAPKDAPQTFASVVKSSNAVKVKTEATPAPKPLPQIETKSSDLCPDKNDDCFIIEKTTTEIVISDDECIPSPQPDELPETTAKTSIPTSPEDNTPLLNPYAIAKLANAQSKKSATTSTETAAIATSTNTSESGEGDVILIDDIENDTRKPSTVIKKTINTIISSGTKTPKAKPRYQSNYTITPRVNKNNSTVTNNITNQPVNQEVAQFSTKTLGECDLHGLVGVEYVVKIIRSRTDVSPIYECGLCKVSMDGGAMQHHLVAYNHRLKYCEMHFPTAMRHYRQYMCKMPEHEVFKVMTAVLHRLTLAIEEHHGRNLPFECKHSEYLNNRSSIMLQVFSCKHASEKNGPSFTHVIDSKEIDVMIEQRNQLKTTVETSKVVFDDQLQKLQQGFQKPASYNSDNDIVHVSTMYPSRQTRRNDMELPAMDNETHKQMVEQFLKGTGQRSDQVYNASRDNFNYANYATSSSGYQTNNFPLQDQFVHRNYDPNANYVQTNYTQTVQHSNYTDFQPAPMNYFSSSEQYNYQNPHPTRSNYQAPGYLPEKRKRLRSRSPSPAPSNKMLPHSRELPVSSAWQKYQKMFDYKSLELQKAYEIYKKEPEAHPLYKREWQKFWKLRKDQLISQSIDHTKYNYQPEWVEYFEERITNLYNDELEALKVECREKLLLPMTNEHLAPKYHVNVGVAKNMEMERSRASNQLTPPKDNRDSGKTLDNNDATNTNEVSVVSVLRLLAALEEHLGVLGPKVVNLLSKTLQMEKTNPQNINKELFNIENCTLIETAKEKFKGLIIAGFLDPSKERALKKAVQQTERLLEMIAAAERDAANVPDNRKIQQPNAMPMENVNKSNEHRKQQTPPNYAELLAQANTKELAMKLANTLSAQGKTDIDTENLQQVIAVYSLLLQKKQAATAANTPTAETSRGSVNCPPTVQVQTTNEKVDNNRFNQQKASQATTSTSTHIRTAYQQQQQQQQQQLQQQQKLQQQQQLQQHQKLQQQQQFNKYNSMNINANANPNPNPNTRNFQYNAFQNASNNRTIYQNPSNSLQNNAQRRFNPPNQPNLNQYQQNYNKNNFSSR